MAGIMDDGFKTTVEFAQDTTIPEMEVLHVKPPGLNMGGANNRTTVSGNTAVRTQKPKKLKSVTASTLSVYWDPAILTVLMTILGVNGAITYTYPDASTWVAWGWVESGEAGTLEEGTIPTLDIEVQFSNLNATNVETVPVYAA